VTFRGSEISIDVPFTVPFVHRLRFTDDVLGADQQVLADLLEPSPSQPARVQFWVDSNLAAAQPDLLDRIINFSRSQGDRLVLEQPVQVIPGGEAVKNDLKLIVRMLQAMNAADLDRRSYVVAVGGGAVLDAVGFAAATAHRGIRLVRLPTSTLGQSDSGVGVKNGVNLFHKKNWLGTFAVPWAVINDARMLHSLSDRDFVCGFSESVKVAMLKDAAMFDELCEVAGRIRQREMQAAWPMLRRSAQLHLDHITRGGDPFEMQLARPLDFGHWSAHRLESMTDFRLRHGEAVAIGVAIDTMYSSLALSLPSADAQRVLVCLRDLGLPLSDPALAATDDLFRGLEEFRQHLGGQFTLTLVDAIGHSVDVHEIDALRMKQAIEHVVRFSQRCAVGGSISGRAERS
jgi:3-dehydroquinate synthase